MSGPLQSPSRTALTVRINEQKEVTQTNTITQNQQGAVVAPGQAQVNDDTEIVIEQEPARLHLRRGSNCPTWSLVNAVGASPADLVAILEALREADRSARNYRDLGAADAE